MLKEDNSIVWKRLKWVKFKIVEPQVKVIPKATPLDKYWIWMRKVIEMKDCDDTEPEPSPWPFNSLWNHYIAISPKSFSPTPNAPMLTAKNIHFRTNSIFDPIRENKSHKSNIVSPNRQVNVTELSTRLHSWPSRWSPYNGKQWSLKQWYQDSICERIS